MSQADHTEDEVEEARHRGRPPVVAAHWAVVAIALIMIVGSMAAARDFLMPVFAAILLALVFRPVRRGLNRLGIGDGIAAFLITGALLAALAALVMALAQPASSWVEDAPRIAHQIERKLQSLQGTMEKVTEAARQIDEIAEGGDDATEVTATGSSTGGVSAVQIEVREDSPGIVARIASGAPVVFGQIAFTLALLFFVLASGDLFRQRVVEVIPSFRDKRRAMSIANDIERRLGHYLFTITAINAGLGTVIGLAMWALGMPDPLLIGVCAFLLNYMPYVGAVVGTVSAVAIGLLSLPDLWMAGVAGGIYFLATSLEGQFVTPYFVGRSLKLNPVVVFLSVAFWAWLWSVVGMVIAVPMLVVLRVFSEHVPALRGFGRFLAAQGDRPPGDPDLP